MAARCGLLFKHIIRKIEYILIKIFIFYLIGFLGIIINISLEKWVHNLGYKLSGRFLGYMFASVVVYILQSNVVFNKDMEYGSLFRFISWTLISAVLYSILQKIISFKVAYYTSRISAILLVGILNYLVSAYYIFEE